MAPAPVSADAVYQRAQKILAAVTDHTAPVSPDAVKIHATAIAEFHRKLPGFVPRVADVHGQIKQHTAWANAVTAATAEKAPFGWLLVEFMRASIPHEPGQPLPDTGARVLVVELAQKVCGGVLNTVVYHSDVADPITVDPARPARIADYAERLHEYAANLRFLRLMSSCGIRLSL